MLTNFVNYHNYVSSTFTRNKGFTNIETSLSIPRKKAIKILNSFTPQGASPKDCIRIGSYEDFIGVGYYTMKSDTRAKLNTFLYDVDFNRFTTFCPNIFGFFSDMDRLQILGNKYLHQDLLDLQSIFGPNGFSKILFSYLCGDNIIIVHPKHIERIKFIATMLSLAPSIVLKYNRITSRCYELDGNENIIGVNELPIRYRSHKKLYLPLDSIFVDLERGIIDGNGVKDSKFTQLMGKISLEEYEVIFEMTRDFFSKICLKEDFKKIDETTSILIERIKAKLGIIDRMNETWLADF